MQHYGLSTAAAREQRQPLRARRQPASQAEGDGDFDDYAAAEALEKKRQAIVAHYLEALRRKRRLAKRSENLRFREVFHAPEPAAVVIAALLVVVVTLAVTKSWPFDHY